LNFLASRKEKILKFSEQEILHDIWMLENQFETAFEFIAFWLLFPTKRGTGPAIEKVSPNWFEGLREMIERAAKDDNDGR
jgi:hypothetical protein